MFATYLTLALLAPMGIMTAVLICTIDPLVLVLSLAVLLAHELIITWCCLEAAHT